MLVLLSGLSRGHWVKITKKTNPVLSLNTNLLKLLIFSIKMYCRTGEFKVGWTAIGQILQQFLAVNAWCSAFLQEALCLNQLLGKSPGITETDKYQCVIQQVASSCFRKNEDDVDVCGNCART